MEGVAGLFTVFAWSGRAGGAALVSERARRPSSFRAQGVAAAPGLVVIAPFFPGRSMERTRTSRRLNLVSLVVCRLW